MHLLNWLFRAFLPGGFFSPGLVNQQASFAADVSN